MATGSSARDPYSSVDVLADRFGLTSAQALKLRRYAAMLAEDQHAPTTVREPQRVIDDHLADALVALSLPALRGVSRLADIGAGAGVPGVVLAVALPAAQVTLVEGSSRKCDFLRAVGEALELENLQVAHTRVESWEAGLGRMDLVTARAVAPLQVVCEYAAPLLKVGGALLAWRGRRDPEVERAAAAACEVVGLSAAAPLQVHPYAGAEHRHLHLMTKTRETPSRFPRRPGMAAKRPLGHA
jgi:16S rRNA (guanine527-N7)-methyltransferase